MIELVIFILGISLFLYTVLGGADFGAGMVELLTGRRAVRTISEAIAPVWEANHVWLILVIVVVFNGFPKVYSTLSTVLHIPLLLVLIGMIFRGTAFTFRHYDVEDHPTHRHYDFWFRASSLVTPFFLGITLGAMILGKITLDYEAGFYTVFIAPWLNIFCISLGLFSILLFSYISAVFLLGEVRTDEGYTIIRKYAKQSLIALMLMGGGVMAAAEWNDFNLFSTFVKNPISITAAILTTLLIPLIFKAVDQKKILSMRLLTGLQVAAILSGWAAIQFPDFIRLSDGTALTMYNTASPEATFVQLTIALVIGVLLVIPAFLYLFKVFKW